MGGVNVDSRFCGDGDGRMDCRFKVFGGMERGGIIADLGFWPDRDGRSDCRFKFLVGLV